MNMASSRSHCIYIFTVQQELTKEKRYYFSAGYFQDLMN